MASLYDTDIDSKFYGTGSKNWIGIVLPFESQEQQIKGNGGYGFRRRVAIMGHHPSTGEIKDTNIAFALIQLSLTDGTGAANRSRKVRVYQGDVVVGVFLDDAKQHPMITGILGRTNPDAKIYGKGRFDIKSGFASGSSSKPLALTSGPETTGDNSPCFALAITGSKQKRKSASEKLLKGGLGTKAKLNALPKPKLNPKDIFNLLKENPDINLESITGGLTDQLGDLPSSLSEAFSDPSSFIDPAQFFNVGEAGSFLKDDSLLNQINLEQFGQVFESD